ncbi:MAG: 16S rRNA (cytosine(1402)-N(4))-methyltransferase RsmH [Synergistaceae bacterium]|nr:16S rRNA (cytosine(1402)-N(4))-methyltransferase RsmH [Synergistaceae bacterium]
MKEHIPVMVNEVLEALRPWEDVGTAVDATLGLGGHTGYILNNCPNAYIIGFDQDPYARKIAQENLSQYSERFEIEADNFRHIEKLKERPQWTGATAVLFDLGVSNMQITESERGFSFQGDGPLNMRMDAAGSSNSTFTAKDILDNSSIKELTEIFRNYGEERYSYEIARGIIRNREQGESLNTTGELVELIRKILPAPVQRKMGGHPARKIFQALRIAVNDEIRSLEEALDGSLKILKPDGKMLVISYHSLEDRMVKTRFRKWQEEGLGKAKPRKAITPTENEIENNYKSRSAKLRIFVSEINTSKKGDKADALHRIPT